MHDKTYFVAVPKRISILDIPASHKMVAGSIFTRTFLRDIGGFEMITQRYIMEDWGIQETAITSAIRWLKENGFIETKRTRYGTLVKWMGEDREVKDGTDFRTTENEVPEKRDSRNTGVENPEIRGSRTPKNGDALLRLDPRLILTPEAAAVARDDGGEPFETISSAILPAPSKPAIPAGLSTLASQLGPHAERWLYSHVTSGTSPDDWRLATVLRETAGMNLRSPKLLEMKFNDLPEAKPAPAAGSAKPDRITTKDGKRVLVNGQWVNSASPYPNQPALGEGPPPRLNQSSGYQKPAGRPLGGILGEQVVEMTLAEQAANGAALAAKEKEAAESRLRAAEARAKIEADRVARKDLMKRRHDRQSDLMAQGKKLAEVGDILRREGLAE